MYSNRVASSLVDFHREIADIWLIKLYLMKLYLGVLLVLFSCAELNSALQSTQLSQDQLTESEVIKGLKAALEKGIATASANASKEDGYFKNTLIRIPFPPDSKKVEDRLRQIGMGSEVDKFVLSLNRAAEKASAKAVDVFVGSIRQMSVQDAWGILKGEQDAATQYLKKTTSQQLNAEFRPIVKVALDQVNATRYYTDLVTTYNKIPFVTKVNPDLEAYATEKAIDGLFTLVAQEEAKIRENPLERTSDILRKVFGFSE